MTPAIYPTWILTSVIISRVFLATYLLQSSFVGVLKFAAGGGMIAIVEFLLGTCIATGKLMPLAAGLVFLGTIISSVPMFQSHSVHLSPENWKAVFVLIASGILLISAWITEISEESSIPTRRGGFAEERLLSDPDPWNQDIAITVRLGTRRFGILQKRQCIVTVHVPPRTDQSARHGIGNALDGN